MVTKQKLFELNFRNLGHHVMDETLYLRLDIINKLQQILSR